MAKPSLISGLASAEKSSADESTSTAEVLFKRFDGGDTQQRLDALRGLISLANADEEEEETEPSKPSLMGDE
jgi:uncharacterized tellurite resistance protein B-like protein